MECLQQCLIIVTLISSFISEVTPLAHIQVTKVYTDKVVLSIKKSAESNTPSNAPCSLHYYITENGKGGEKYSELENWDEETVTISHLQSGTSYTVFLQCGNSQPSNTVTFNTEISDKVASTTPYTGPDVIKKETQLFSATTLDIVLGVLFSVVALTIVAVMFLYLYRRHQRRQRLQNFLRTPHTDPFESLQDYVE